MQDALRALLKDFADDAPYPDGNIRFGMKPWSLPGDEPELRSETVTFKTDGGMLLDDVLRALSMAALAVAVIASAFGQAEIAIPAFWISGMLGGAAGAVSLFDRLEHGDFEWNFETGMNLLDIAGAVTLGVGTAISATARGVGSMTLIGRISRGVNEIQIAVLAGNHLTQVVAAARTGKLEKVAEALLHALGDGALILVVHKAAAHASEIRASGRPELPRIEVPVEGRPRIALPEKPAVPKRVRADPPRVSAANPSRPPMCRNPHRNRNLRRSRIPLPRRPHRRPPMCRNPRRNRNLRPSRIPLPRRRRPRRLLR